jgi:hypothetical protein
MRWVLSDPNAAAGGSQIKFVNPNSDNYETNIRHAATLGLPCIKANEHPNMTAVICGSGPSLNDVLDEIREYKEQGAKIYACKAAIKALHDAGIQPDYGVSMDPGAHIAAPEKIFKAPGTTHIIASSSDPALFEYLKDESVQIFHSATGLGLEVELYQELYENGDCIGGGFNVVNRAISVAQYMGAKNIVLAGNDCGWKKDQSFYCDGAEQRPGVNMCDNGKLTLTDTDGNPTSEKNGEILAELMRLRNILNTHVNKGKEVPDEILEELAKYDDILWWTRPDMLASGTSVARLAQRLGPDRFVILGDVIPALLRDKSDDFLKTVSNFS